MKKILTAKQINALHKAAEIIEQLDRDAYDTLIDAGAMPDTTAEQLRMIVGIAIEESEVKA